MHQFPPLPDLPKFIGDEIVQIWLDPWAVRFLFGSGVQLYAEKGYEQSEPDGTIWTYDCDAGSGPPVLVQRLLYRPIVGLERKDLRLTFAMENGARLAILTEIGQFECGNISWPDGRMAIF